MKDYARREFPSDKKPPKKTGHYRVVGLCVIVVLAVFVGFILKFAMAPKQVKQVSPAVVQEAQHQAELKAYIAEAKAKQDDAAKKTEAEKNATAKSQAITADVKKAADTKSNQKDAKKVDQKPAPFQFDFYKVLPSMKVDVQKDSSAQYAHVFVLVFGERTTQKAATDFSNTLGAMGFSVNIVGYTKNGKQQYRIVSDPLPTMSAAQAEQKQARAQGKSSNIIQVR